MAKVPAKNPVNAKIFTGDGFRPDGTLEAAMGMNMILIMMID